MVRLATSTVQIEDTIDLQLHTRASDGQWQPEELLDHLAQRGFRVAAITDHDVTDHLQQLRSLGAARGIHVVPGVEVTASWQGYTAHLLCFAPETIAEPLASACRATVEGQLDNTLAVRAELERRGYRFPFASDALPSSGGQVVRPIDNATLLQQHGYTHTSDDAMRLIVSAGYRMITLPLREAIERAHAAGALAVLAHPGRGDSELHRYEPQELDDMLDVLPLDGIETLYPTHSAADVKAYSALARQRGLLTSAGSDSHGPDSRLPIAYPAKTCAALLDRCGMYMPG